MSDQRGAKSGQAHALALREFDFKKSPGHCNSVKDPANRPGCA